MLTCLGIGLGMGLTVQAQAADYVAMVNALEPVAHYRFSNTNQIVEYSAVNQGTLGTEFNGQNAVNGNDRSGWQVYHNGFCADGPSLVLTDLAPSDAGEYALMVTNPLGSVTNTATLTLVTPTKLGAAATALGPLGY